MHGRPIVKEARRGDDGEVRMGHVQIVVKGGWRDDTLTVIEFVSS